jgi:hypothetical protein
MALKNKKKVLLIGGGGVSTYFKSFPEYSTAKFLISRGYDVAAFSCLGSFPFDKRKEKIYNIMSEGTTYITYLKWVECSQK